MLQEINLAKQSMKPKIFNTGNKPDYGIELGLGGGGGGGGGGILLNSVNPAKFCILPCKMDFEVGKSVAGTCMTNPYIAANTMLARSQRNLPTLNLGSHRSLMVKTNSHGNLPFNFDWAMNIIKYDPPPIHEHDAKFTGPNKSLPHTFSGTKLIAALFYGFLCSYYMIPVKNKSKTKSSGLVSTP